MAILTIDIGGTAIKYAVMTEDADILRRGSVPTPQTGRGALIDALAALYADTPEAEGIAIAMPGIIDTENGYCAMGGALRYNDGFHLRRALQEKCPVPVCMENDAKCAAMAEARLGALRDVEDGFVIVLGTMIGGAFIKGHRLHRGKHFSAGAVSFINTVRDGHPVPENVWGNRCGASGLCAMYAQRKGLNAENVDGVQVFAALDGGDADAAAALRDYAREVAVQIFNLQNILDPERFAIGGGISARPELVEAIREQLEELYGACPYPVPHAEVTVCRFRNDANLYGALQCYLAQRG